MERIVLTAEQMRNARTYLPLAKKIAFAEVAAQKSRLRVSLANSADGNALPDMFMESPERKMRFLQGLLVKYYLGLDFEGAEGEEYLMSADDFDRYAGSHILNQIERLKANKDARDICFDLLADYKVAEKMLNAELYGTVQIQNDLLGRAISYLKETTTPEHMRDLTEQMQAAEAELTRYITERGERRNGDGGIV